MDEGTGARVEQLQDTAAHRLPATAVPAPGNYILVAGTQNLKLEMHMYDPCITTYSGGTMICGSILKPEG